jgi:type IV secretion system protein VirD4
VLVLGPPRSGKSSAVMVPAMLAHPGPALSASTKPDVLAATIAARSRLGCAWRFDPTGLGSDRAARGLRWSPVSASRSWDGALLMARAMVAGAGVGAGTMDGTHWSKRATALLAALLHAAALDARGMDVVLDWVLRHELDEPGIALETAQAKLACGLLIGLQNTEARERSSICSAAADALDAYSSEAALAAASDPNFDADRFVRSRDTIYVHAPAEQQALAAPLVCGLLAEIRRATYQAHNAGELRGRMLWALDEVANIAPLAELPAVASEGGGQGLALVAAFQDLSQARARWGTAADGFLTLFGSKLILPGVADATTLESLSLALGEYDREMVATNRRRGRGSAQDVLGGFFPEITKTISTQRQRVLSPGEIANIPSGQALYLDGLSWELIGLTPAYRDEPWRTLTQLPATSPHGTAGRVAEAVR